MSSTIEQKRPRPYGTERNRPTIHWPDWGWSLIGVFAVWACIIAVRPGAPIEPVVQALTLAPFLVLVALGQMLVITLGPGNIDISVGAIVSMSSYVSVAVGLSYGPLLGLIAAVIAGCGAAVCSVIAILVLRVPPIIATLATSLMVTSATLLLAAANRGGVSAELRHFINARVLGVPLIAVLVVAVTALIAFMLTRTPYGLSVIAVGQSARAAERAGIKVRAVTAITYLASGSFAGLAGGLLAAYISPSTALGTSYLLDSIAVVVIGGTLIAGGRPVPIGVWTGALFLVLLSGLLNLVGWNIGAQNVLKGILVVAVVSISVKATGTRPSVLSGWRQSLQNRTTSSKETTHA